MSSTLIELRNVYKIFGRDSRSLRAAQEAARKGSSRQDILESTQCTVAVRDVSLEIREGEIFVIMGLSGSGKSTLVRHFNRLIEPTAGQLLFRGKDLLKLSKSEMRNVRRYNIGMVFQSFALLPHKTVMENIIFGRMLRGDSKSTSIAEAEKWLQGRIGLRGYGDKFPDELSGGMRQRVGLARALVSNPDILLMDEAFSALDPLIRTDLQDLLLEMQTELKKTVIFITHDIDEAMKLGSRIAIMKDGEVVQVGTPQVIRDNPANDYVRRFFKKGPAH
ncbi:glycine betaine/L-proline transport ATP binding subunit [Burkholderia gladioli]|uniref:Quaternary amine transport ATP-binding protein n=1 Tax=Burkholderia gladioli TaxID=28095 RepID=A0A095F1Q9_BURGA|nr:betaine/proline/choline family ABC transporter ATP-binding protein [Burkholderia gladioli]AJW99576.1 glycine betaine/L-proline transport ATP binding subunit [Burkholderia gladioli]ASD79886.1 ABC transporter ATP-binding protein [Burkholderia gladioli pv. gladioli]AWY54872.1 ABC transporter ATP-binding protein [Burkholderia gladioli pv. gladioli]KGC11288.1 glycine betaine/L-proline transport ATP binding subunit [Burkholderia gladioli]PEH37882.1 ABC transporter ATP-binding protein [Burkholderi